MLRLHVGHRRVGRRRLGDGELDRRRRSRASTCGPFDVRRFGAAPGQAVHVRARGRELRPLLHDRAGRRRSALGARRAAQPAAQRLGGEAAPSTATSSAGSGRTGSRPTARTPSTAVVRGAAGWFDAIGAEHRAVRERVALIDMSSFSKYEVRGPGALALLQQLAANDLDRPVGTIVYTQLCNERGGIEADVTITRLAEDRFYFVTGSGFGVRDGRRSQHLPRDGSVAIARRHVGEGGAQPLRPALARRARESTDAPLTTRASRTWRRAPISATRRSLALRVTYLGELGYELHVPVEYALHSTSACGRPARRSASPMPAIARSTACGSRSTISPGAPISRRITIRTRRASASAWRSTKGDFLGREALAKGRRGPAAAAQLVHSPTSCRSSAASDLACGDAARHHDERRLRLHDRQEHRLRLRAGRARRARDLRDRDLRPPRPGGALRQGAVRSGTAKILV